MNRQTTMPATLMVCSLNINCSNAATQAVMHNISKHRKPAIDILLIQEPWWHKVNNSYISVALKGWQTVLLKQPIAEGDRPRTIAYFRQNANIEPMLRNNIASDLDFMILNIKRNGSTQQPVRLINIYNQKTLVANQRKEFMVERLVDSTLEVDIPTILM